MGATTERMHPLPGGDEDLTRIRNADARRGRLVRGVMLAVALIYVAILLLAPLAGIFIYALRSGLGMIGRTFGEADVQHAFVLTFLIMVVTVVVTTVFGVVVALVLARDRFPGKRFVSALVDLPLAISPVVVGLMAVLLFGRGGSFEPFFAARGIQIMFALPAMILVTIFISIPFVIREVVPVLQELGMEEEQAAWTLGASRVQTFFRVTLRNIRWGLLYGIALSAARSIGEVGAVLIVSGAIQGRTETATLYILRAFDQYQDQQAYIVALTLAAFSIVLLIGIETFKRRKTAEADR
jgi:sulfate/thiosulfate transport system permease protein